VAACIREGRRLSEAEYAPEGLGNRHGRNIVALLHGPPAHADHPPRGAEETSPAPAVPPVPPVPPVPAVASPPPQPAQAPAGRGGHIASAQDEPEAFLKQYFAQSRLHFIGDPPPPPPSPLCPRASALPKHSADTHLPSLCACRVSQGAGGTACRT
jgi:hypothetical protein